MRTTNKPVWHFYLYLIILLVAGGCSDDDIQRNSFGSTLTESGDHLISSFTLPEGKTEFVDDDGIIYFQLRSLSDNSQLDFEGRLKRTSGLLSCDLFIPHGQAIVDGDYVVWIRKEADGDIYPQCYRLTFQDHMVCGVQSSLHQYDQLVGEGTDTNPYLISSTEDFAYLMRQLLMYDSDYGKGQYFKQICNIDAPVTECLYQGNGYKSAPFAGIYDGGENKISPLRYTGTNNSEKDSYVGLFSALYDGAVIRNLSIGDAHIQKPASKCGLLAGAAQGNVRIENVTVSGEITTGGEMIGGLIGYAEGTGNTPGNLTIQDVKVDVGFVGCGPYTGGLIGWAENVHMNVKNIGSNYPFGSLEGGEHSGGLIGKLYGRIDADSIRFAHSTDDRDMVIVSGKSFTGGLIGELFMTGSCSLKNVTINYPISGTSEVGGLAGKVVSDGAAPYTLAIDSYQLPLGSLMVKGNGYVGGLIGSLNPPDGGGITLQFAGNSLLTSNIEVAGDYGGGVLGRVYNANIEFQTSSTLTIDIGHINATSRGGGFAGYMESCGTVNLGNVRMSGYTEVNALEYAGGFAGSLLTTTLQGTYKPVFSRTDVVVNNSDKAFFSGKVNSGALYSGAKYVGGLVGWAEKSRINGFYVTPTVTGVNYVGGIAGYIVDTPVGDCASKCGVFNGTGSGSEALGGLIGYLCSDWAECGYENLINYSSAVISGGTNVGGIIGHVESKGTGVVIKLTNAVNLGDVSVNMTGGGIVGWCSGNGSFEIYNAANYGTIKGILGDKSSGLGGIAGTCAYRTTVYNSVNHGTVMTGSNAGYMGVGGLVGYFSGGNGMHIRYCCNRGTVDFPKSKEDYGCVGGILGKVEGAKKDDDNHILDCYNAGEIKGQQGGASTTSGDHRGGIAGSLGSNSRCYRAVNTGNVEKGNGAVGTTDLVTRDLTHLYIRNGSGKNWESSIVSDADKDKQDLYSGFDFKGVNGPDYKPVWSLDDASVNSGFPYLHPDRCYFQVAEYKE